MACFKATVKDMNENGFYNWNDVYPDTKIVKEDITAETVVS